jgi:hypothetical protein
MSTASNSSSFYCFSSCYSTIELGIPNLTLSDDSNGKPSTDNSTSLALCYAMDLLMYLAYDWSISEGCNQSEVSVGILFDSKISLASIVLSTYHLFTVMDRMSEPRFSFRLKKDVDDGGRYCQTSLYEVSG